MVQSGDEPLDWKPLRGVGHGAMEIRVRRGGAFRVVYVAKFADAVYVLHCFGKKTEKTSRTDIDLVIRRYGEMMALWKTEES